MREQRFSVNFPVHLTWQEKAGQTQRVTGRCMDLSSEGMKIEVRDRLEAGTTVLADSNEFGRMGHTVVKYCQRDKMRYVVGLRFSTPFALGDPVRMKIIERIVTPAV